MLSQGIRSVIDGGVSAGNEALLVNSVLKSFVIVFILGLATAFRFFFITYVGERVVADIRRKINDKILDYLSDDLNIKDDVKNLIPEIN